MLHVLTIGCRNYTVMEADVDNVPGQIQKILEEFADDSPDCVQTKSVQLIEKWGTEDAKTVASVQFLNIHDYTVTVAVHELNDRNVTTRYYEINFDHDLKSNKIGLITYHNIPA